MKTILASILIAGMAMAQEAEPKPAPTLAEQLAYIWYAQTGELMQDGPFGPWVPQMDKTGKVTILGKNAPKLEDVQKVTAEQIATLPPKPLTPAEQEIADLKARIAELETKEADIDLRVKELETKVAAEETAK